MLLRLIGILLCSVVSLESAWADQVDEFIRREMQRRHIPGLGLVVLKDGKPIKQQSYGAANLELNVQATLDSVYPLASVTK